MRALLAALSCLAFAGSACGAGSSKERGEDEAEHAILEAGPVLAGDGVVWGEGGFDHILVWSGSSGKRPELVYRKDGDKTRPHWRLTGLAASPSRVAFIRDWSECWEPPKPKEPPKPGEAVPEGGCAGNNSDVLTGPAIGPFEQVYEPPPACDWTGEVYDLDVSRESIVFSETYCREDGGDGSRIALRDYAADTTSALLETPCCGGEVRIAGRFAAWVLWPPTRVFVYDLVARKVVYVAKLERTYLGGTALDLQDDGTLIVVYRTRSPEEPSRVSWYSVSSPKPHHVDLPARSQVRLAAGRFVFERPRGKDGSELVMATLEGGARTLVEFEKPVRRFGDFDFDGRRLAWATATIEKSRTKCGPRECFQELSGRIEIWVADTGDLPSTARLVARSRFEDIDAQVLAADAEDP